MWSKIDPNYSQVEQDGKSLKQITEMQQEVRCPRDLSLGLLTSCFSRSKIAMYSDVKGGWWVTFVLYCVYVAVFSGGNGSGSVFCLFVGAQASMCKCKVLWVYCLQ